MGFLSALEPQYRLPAPDTPPGLVSPTSSSSSSSSSSSRPSEDHRSWHLGAPISPPMSNYDQQSNPDMSSGKAADEMPARRDAGPAAPRQQLPSLSSLFGPPPSVRPLHSPHSEYPGPSYPATSPLDRPLRPEHSASSSSYFPSTSAPSYSQPRSVYEPRLDERAPLQPSTRAPFPGPLSPRSRELDHHRTDSRSDYAPSSSWSSIHQDSSRSEYSYGGREPRLYSSSSSLSQDRYLPPLAGQKRDHDGGARDYRDPRSLHAPGYNPGHQSQASSSVGSSTESIPTKDGLGPKIWTGTHFLPRFVRAAEVPGEGMCYFYDDGSHCKTVIDGEAVNAHWGVTKAGKPRKRLAIACVTCREKKIKCDPDYPRCVQCEKFGRVCKFKNAPRGGHNTSPTTPPAEREESPQRPAPGGLGGHQHAPPYERAQHGSHSSPSVSPRTTLRASSPGPAKRARLSYDQGGYEQYPPPRPPMAAQPQRHQQHQPLPPPVPDKARAGLAWQQPELPRIHEDVLRRSWQADSYVSDSQSVARSTPTTTTTSTSTTSTTNTASSMYTSNPRHASPAASSPRQASRPEL